ncbi:MAG: DUF308 domain-containing protein [Lachnospiraceae bacterium]|nr:DUF308 domain-containing protein [Lachnospiraceae bacterium]
MKNLKENTGNLIMCLCEAVIGILLLMNPTGFTSFVIIALGAVLAVRGIVSVIAYFRAKPEEAAKGQDLASGFILLAVGLFCMTRSEWFIVTFPVLTLIYGVIILFAGITKIQWVADCIRLKKKQWVFALISALLSLISAAVIIKNPFTTTVILWNFTAISLIVEAVLDVVAFFFRCRKQ